MYEADDLLPADVVSWLMEQLRLFRLSGSHGFVQIQIQHGHISACGHFDSDKYPFKEMDKPNHKHKLN